MVIVFKCLKNWHVEARVNFFCLPRGQHNENSFQYKALYASLSTFLYIFKTDFILLNAYDSFHSIKEVNTLWTKTPEAVGI